MRRLTIMENDSGQRLDKFIAKAVPSLPRSQLYKYLRIKRIKRNGKRCDGAEKLVTGDVLELYLNDSWFSEPEYPFLAAPSAVQIAYEDENILLADKQPGLVVHEDDAGEQDTLIHRIQHYLYEKGEYDPALENSFAPALCNRIDRNTGGIVMAAKNFESLQILSEKIKQREIDKRYLCLVHGTPSPPSATLKGWHVKDAATNTVRIHPKPVEGAKTALTRYTVLESRGGQSLVEVELLTGRTHQIRAHMASIGHPLVGDTKYGTNRQNKDTGYRYQALYSYQLRFAFSTDAGRLQYLKGKTVQVEDVPFVARFRNE
ncbi:RluA family pseudouridine synthase [Ruminococcaceae bacterium OttesenSCG-928-L11]|nr:RluA family pseudouridine synthase [Ruminococcaceae bacterium OttesenSCG-928-L11]